MTEQVPEPEPTTRYEIKFEATGSVAEGDGPDALAVPEQEDER